MSPRQRFAIINRIWTRTLGPLRDLIDDRGQVELRFDRLKKVLAQMALSEVAPRAIQRRARHTQARLARTRRVLARSHDEAVREVEPLYEQLRADSRLLEGASRLLEDLRRRGAAALRIDEKMGLEGWRPRGLISDEHLEARLAALKDYEPDAEAQLGALPEAVAYEPLRRDEVAEVLAQACPVEDVLALVLRRWSERTLVERLKIFAWIHRGDFGHCRLAGDGAERIYQADEVELCAWPVALKRVER